jgi:hypothetical protein
MRAPSVHSLGLVKEAKSSHRMQPSAPLSTAPRFFPFFSLPSRARMQSPWPCRISLRMPRFKPRPRPANRADARLHRVPLASQHYQLLFLFLVQPPVDLHLSYLLLYSPYFSPTSFSPVGCRRRLARTAPCPPGSCPRRRCSPARRPAPARGEPRPSPWRLAALSPGQPRRDAHPHPCVRPAPTALHGNAARQPVGRPASLRAPVRASVQARLAGVVVRHRGELASLLPFPFLLVPRRGTRGGPPRPAMAEPPVSHRAGC